MGPTDAMPPTVHRARFADLSAQDLYGILRLRSDVFVVEQDCVFLDLDDRDHEPEAEHLWTSDEAGVTATLRLLHEGGASWSIGRVVARADVRSRGVAAHLVQAGLDRLRELGAETVRIGAQAQLRDWYARFGFAQSGPRYLEDGILHLPMSRTLDEDR
jgi:ElaA protein